ncbi:glycosyltransferase family 4 protein [Candidatus Falkowbacteria bacterium]|nr:glycosyltransferase family 4 protein [Candidatus Falkowbacteria bacterium]
MKIGIDIRTLLDARPSGVSEYVLNLLKEMFKLDTANEYRLFYNCFGDCPNLPEFKQANVKLIKYNYPNKVLNYLLFKIFNYPKLDKDLAVDVFFMPHLNFIGLSVGAKSLLTVHDLSFLKYPEFFSARKNFWHRMVKAKKLLKRFSLVIAVSENTKRDIMELGGINPDKVKVIYSGVGEEYKKLPLINYQFSVKRVRDKYNLPERFILYLGTIEPRKNVDGIIRAYNQLRVMSCELRDYKLIIAGARGWKSENIYREWDKSAFKNDIKFLGYVEPDDKIYLYNLASVFIYPSFYEGFGFPPLEAMACGVPVVASFASSLPEVVGDAALMVDPYNINDLAGALEKVLVDENLKNKLIARGLEQAKKFSWRETARAYLSELNG